MLVLAPAPVMVLVLVELLPSTFVLSAAFVLASALPFSPLLVSPLAFVSVSASAMASVVTWAMLVLLVLVLVRVLALVQPMSLSVSGRESVSVMRWRSRCRECQMASRVWCRTAPGEAPSARLEPGHGAGRRRISNMSRSASAEPETSNRLLAGGAQPRAISRLGGGSRCIHMSVRR